MTWPKRTTIAIATIIMVTIAGVAGADQWNDRTKLTFDAPITIPGATLAPGTYTFKLLDSPTSRQIVQIFNEDGTKLVATTHAVPAKRMDISGDSVLKLNPTETGAPVALKAWFYPGSRYGHEFVYSDRQARDIAQRTKTLVLSEDTAGHSDGKGTLYNYDADGRRADRKQDDAMVSEWQQWDAEGRKAMAKVVAPSGDSESTAPMMHSQPKGMSVSIDDLEEHPTRYIGKTVSVTGEVDDVLGPRLFKIDEPNWADLDGEVLVTVPTTLAAMVREEDRVTVTGTMRMAAKADIHHELDWLGIDDEVVARFTTRPVLVASSVVGGNSNVALAISVSGAGQPSNGKNDKAVGTSGTAGTANSGTLTNASAIGSGGRDLVGRRVNLDKVTVQRTGKEKGLWIDAGGHSIFVLPSDSATAGAKSAGQSASIQGVVLRMPRGMRDASDTVKSANDEIYIFATSIN
jgi:hypothetical protein